MHPGSALKLDHQGTMNGNGKKGNIEVSRTLFAKGHGLYTPKGWWIRFADHPLQVSKSTCLIPLHYPATLILLASLSDKYKLGPFYE